MTSSLATTLRLDRRPLVYLGVIIAASGGVPCAFAQPGIDRVISQYQSLMQEEHAANSQDNAWPMVHLRTPSADEEKLFAAIRELACSELGQR